jgi:uncharacterized iron-regulated membrane protein
MSARVWFRIHSFTGVVTGLLLFVVCWSGTVAVLAHELDWLVTPELRVARGSEPVGWSAIEDAARAAVPDGEPQFVQAPLNPWSAAIVQVGTPGGGVRNVAVDPYRGRVTAVFDGRYTVQRFFRSFHRALFLPDVGHYIVTALSLTMLVSMVAALSFYRRWWTRFFRFRPAKGGAWVTEAHKTVGLWSLWFVLVIALTGVWYLYEGLRADLGDGKVNYAGADASYAVAIVPEPTSPAELPPLALDALVEETRQRWPDFRPTLVARDWSAGGAVYVEGQTGFPLVRGRANQVNLDPRSGEVLLAHRAEDLSTYWLWSNMADPLHFGDFAGLWSKIPWFLFGALLSGLVFTGTVLHARRLAAGAGNASRHRWPGTAAAIASSTG